jgi:hypothetical protein
MSREPLAIELLVTEYQRRTTPNSPAEFRDALAPVMPGAGSCDAGAMSPPAEPNAATGAVGGTQNPEKIHP